MALNSDSIGIYPSILPASQKRIMFLSLTLSFFSYKYQRNGYAFEILSNLIEVIHERYKNYEIVAMTDKENEASINLLKKLGFVNEGYEERVESYIFSLYAD